MLICNSILKASRKLFLCDARHISSDLISCDLGRLFRKVFDADATLKNAVRFHLTGKIKDSKPSDLKKAFRNEIMNQTINFKMDLFREGHGYAKF